MHGIIDYPEGTRRSDFLFRMSLKAVIVNSLGELLVVKETGHNFWDIPGGGLDHGETIKEALARELYEEVGFKGDFYYEPLIVEDPHVMGSFNLYQMRAIFIVSPSNFDFQPGEDGDELKFVPADTFKDSALPTEQKLYNYSQLALKHLKR